MDNCIINQLPREKIEQYGTDNLNDLELLTLLLGSGTKQINVYALAKKLLPIIDKQNHNLSLEDLLAVPGIGKAKATLLIAALEFSRRRIRPKGVKVKSITDIIPLVKHYAARPQEHFICITLNGANEVIACRVITIGLVNLSQVHPREVFADAICDRACSVILAHNHPSGNTLPSKEDLAVTKILVESGNLLGIKVLDHIIFTEEDYASILSS